MGAAVSCIPDAVEAELVMLLRNGSTDPGKALDILDEKPIPAQARDQPVLLIPKYHL